MDVNSKYVIGDKEIGSGHYGVVRTCTSRGEQERMGSRCIMCSRTEPVSFRKNKTFSVVPIYLCVEGHNFVWTSPCPRRRVFMI